MAIICYAGLPGAGKSYSVIENVVIPALKERRHVVHNLVLNDAALQLVADPGDGKPFKVAELLHQLPNAKQGDGTFDAKVADKVVELSRPGAVVVLDEVWQYWPAGLKVNETPVHHLDYFKKHRHRVDADTGHATEIVLIDQDPMSVPAWLRALIDLTYLHEKLDKVGAKGSFRVEVYTRAQSAEKPRKSAHIRTLLGKYKPQVWNCYQSHTESKRPQEAGLEKAPDSRGNVWKSWPLRAAVLGAVALPVALWWAWSTVQGIGRPKAEAVRPALQASVSERAPAAGLVEVARPPSPAHGPKTVTTFTPAGSPLPDGAVPAAIPAEPTQADKFAAAIAELAPSSTWRLLGFIYAGSDRRAIMTSAGGRRLTYGEGCERFEADWRCKVEDGYAYAWSGSARQLSAALPEGAGQGGTPIAKADPATVVR